MFYGGMPGIPGYGMPMMGMGGGMEGLFIGMQMMQMMEMTRGLMGPPGFGYGGYGGYGGNPGMMPMPMGDAFGGYLGTPPMGYGEPFPPQVPWTGGYPAGPMEGPMPYNPAAGANLAETAVDWSGHYFKPGQTRRCADFVSTMIERSGSAPPGFHHQVSAAGLARYGTPVAPGELRPGDLVFFGNTYRPGKYTHVGIYIGDGRFVHRPTADEPVRVDRLDRGYYARHLSDARRLSGVEGEGCAGGMEPDPSVGIPRCGSDPSRAQVGQMLDCAAHKYGIPPNILKAVAWQESSWRANASSFDGGHGKGIMQIDDRSHAFARTPEVWNASDNINYGAHYLRHLYDETGSWGAALKRYNGGSSYPPKIFAEAQSQPWTRYT